ncbi:MAG: nitroreductase/quinone reductase family protein, partial [Candidatus Binatia bacterium]|nr:nitroreductase/quinone reductase family protein [Candidatus Binatia bacterium]
PEEEKLWAVMIEVMPWFQNYRAGTNRTIPLVILEPREISPGEATI